MNYRTGLFRLWLVLSVLWFGYVATAWPLADENQFGPYAYVEGEGSPTT